MKARYAYLLSQQYKRIADKHDINENMAHLYLFIYPQIYNAVRNGRSNVMLASQPPPPVIFLLRQFGYKVHIMGNSATIDWGDTPVI